MHRGLQHLFLIGLLLVSGVMINIAVAWGLVIFVVDFTTQYPFARESYNQIEVSAFWYRGTASDKYVIHFIDHDLVRINSVRLWEDPLPSIRDVVPETVEMRVPSAFMNQLTPIQSAYTDFRGWPLRSMYSRTESAYVNRHLQIVDATILGGGHLGMQDPFEEYPRILPLRPLWPGFLVNTLFYALSIWLIFIAPFVLRRTIRRGRGLCASCAYPIGVSPLCTECGATVSRSKPSSALSVGSAVNIRPALTDTTSGRATG